MHDRFYGPYQVVSVPFFYQPAQSNRRTKSLCAACDRSLSPISARHTHTQTQNVARLIPPLIGRAPLAADDRRPIATRTRSRRLLFIQCVRACTLDHAIVRRSLPLRFVRSPVPCGFEHIIRPALSDRHPCSTCSIYYIRINIECFVNARAPSSIG